MPPVRRYQTVTNAPQTCYARFTLSGRQQVYEALDIRLGKSVSAARYDAEQRVATTVCPECVDQVAHVSPKARQAHFRHTTPFDRAPRLCSRRVTEAPDHGNCTRIMTAVMSAMGQPARLSIVRVLAVNLVPVMRELGILGRDPEMHRRVLDDDLLDFLAPNRRVWADLLLAAARNRPEMTDRQQMLLRHLCEARVDDGSGGPFDQLLAAGWASAREDLRYRQRYHPGAFANLGEEARCLVSVLEGQALGRPIELNPRLGGILGLKEEPPSPEALARVLVAQRTVGVIAQIDIDRLLADPDGYVGAGWGWVYLMSRRAKVRVPGTERVVKIGRTDRSVAVRREEIAAAYPDMDWLVLDGALVQAPATVEAALKAVFAAHRPSHWSKNEYFSLPDGEALALFRRIVDGHAARPLPELLHEVHSASPFIVPAEQHEPRRRREKPTHVAPQSARKSLKQAGNLLRRQQRQILRTLIREALSRMKPSTVLALAEDALAAEAFKSNPPPLPPELATIPGEEISFKEVLSELTTTPVYRAEVSRQRQELQALLIRDVWERTRTEKALVYYISKLRYERQMPYTLLRETKSDDRIRKLLGELGWKLTFVDGKSVVALDGGEQPKAAAPAMMVPQWTRTRMTQVRASGLSAPSAPLDDAEQTRRKRALENWLKNR